MKAEPEPAADAESSPPTSEAETSPPEGIHEEAPPPSQAPVPPTSVCESTVAASVPLPVLIEAALHEDLTKANKERHHWTLQGGKPNREVIRGTYRRMADFVVSTTDPDATVMPTKGEGRHLGYHTHYVVDGGKVRIIMAVLVTPKARDGKPTHARPRLPHPLPLETVAAPSHRRYDLWNGGKHRGA